MIFTAILRVKTPTAVMWQVYMQFWKITLAIFYVAISMIRVVSMAIRMMSGHMCRFVAIGTFRHILSGLGLVMEHMYGFCFLSRFRLDKQDDLAMLFLPRQWNAKEECHSNHTIGSSLIKIFCLRVALEISWHCHCKDEHVGMATACL